MEDIPKRSGNGFIPSSFIFFFLDISSMIIKVRVFVGSLMCLSKGQMFWLFMWAGFHYPRSVHCRTKASICSLHPTTVYCRSCEFELKITLV